MGTSSNIKRYKCPACGRFIIRPIGKSKEDDSDYFTEIYCHVKDLHYEWNLTKNVATPIDKG